MYIIQLKIHAWSGNYIIKTPGCVYVSEGRVSHDVRKCITQLSNPDL